MDGTLMDFHADYRRRAESHGDISDHLSTLYRYAAAGDCRIIELGVRGGDSTTTFLAAITEHGGELWSCDVSRPRFLVDYQQTCPSWTFVIGDDLWAAAQAPDGVDIVFIDTSHTYAQTQAELDLYADKVRPGGVILLHDTELEYPEASPSSDPPFPVRVAVEEFVDERGWVLELIHGCNGLGVIHVPEANDG